MLLPYSYFTFQISSIYIIIIDISRVFCKYIFLLFPRLFRTVLIVKSFISWFQLPKKDCFVNYVTKFPKNYSSWQVENSADICNVLALEFSVDLTLMWKYHYQIHHSFECYIYLVHKEKLLQFFLIFDNSFSETGPQRISH